MRQRSGLAALFIISGIFVAIAGHCFFVWLKDRVKTAMTDIVSAALCAPVSIDDIAFDALDGKLIVKGFSARDTGLFVHKHAIGADEIYADADILSFLIDGDIVLKRAYFDSFFVEIDKGIIKPAQPYSDRAGWDPPDRAVRCIGLARAPRIAVESVILGGGRVTWRDYNHASFPVLVEIKDINGVIDKMHADPLARKLEANIKIGGYVNPDGSGSIVIDGSFRRVGDKNSFSITARLQGIDLTLFAPYYERTISPVINTAKVDIVSRAACADNMLEAGQDVRMFGLSVDDRKMMSEETLFGATALTIRDFIKESGEQVDFTFDLAGPLGEIKFKAGPVLKPILAKALTDKMALQVSEIPDKMSEAGQEVMETGTKVIKRAGIIP